MGYFHNDRQQRESGMGSSGAKYRYKVTGPAGIGYCFSIEGLEQELKTQREAGGEKLVLELL